MKSQADGLAAASHAMTVASDPHGQALTVGINYHIGGKTKQAEEIYHTILATHEASPHTSAMASYGLGLLCMAEGRAAEAIDAYRRAITARPDFADAYINLGTIFLDLGQAQEAITLFRQAISLETGNGLAWGNLGKAFHDIDRLDDALAAYRCAMARDPYNSTFHANLGAALLGRQQWLDSLIATARAVALQPGTAMPWVNLGTALMRLGRHDAALSACLTAAALAPRDGATLTSLGGALLELGAAQEAIEICQQAVSLNGDLATAHFNLSHAFKAMNRLDEAMASAQRALALHPGSAEYHFHLSHILLLRGDLVGGWTEYEWRWRLPDFAWLVARHGVLPQPRWEGEDISDKAILIYTEQGLGDIILFARFLPLVVAQAGKVIVAANPAVRRLLTTIGGVDVVSVRDVPLPPFDVHCPLASLPRVLTISFDTLPTTVPYLFLEPTTQARWERRLGGSTPRVGIVWAGNPATRRDRFRSPGLASVEPLFSIQGIDFIALQLNSEAGEGDPNRLPPNVCDLGGQITDLADTAAIMAQLDLMISSCTAPLHLAGALGIPTWAMIPFAPYFPWGLRDDHTPWYPTLRLYRQKQPGQDWSEVVQRIAADLAAWLESGEDLTLTRTMRESARTGQTDAAVDERKSAMDLTTSAVNHAGSDVRIEFNELARCRSGPMLFNRNDLYIGASLRKYGEFSHEEVELFRLIVQPGTTVLDIGANIGAHTVNLSRFTGDAGKVYAFEPQRLMFQLLCANAALNNCSNVFALQSAIGAEVGITRAPSPDPTHGLNFGGLSLPGLTNGEPVPMATIDSLDLDTCYFIKIDNEGMETEALRGGETTIRRFRPFLYIENDRQDRSVELISVIQEYGYRLYWHFPPLFNPNNFRGDPENIFGDKVSVNMICIPIELPGVRLSNLRQVTGPTDSGIIW